MDCKLNTTTVPVRSAFANIDDELQDNRREITSLQRQLCRLREEHTILVERLRNDHEERMNLLLVDLTVVRGQRDDFAAEAQTERSRASALDVDYAKSCDQLERAYKYLQDERQSLTGSLAMIDQIKVESRDLNEKLRVVETERDALRVENMKIVENDVRIMAMVKNIMNTARRSGLGVETLHIKEENSDLDTFPSPTETVDIDFQGAQSSFPLTPSQPEDTIAKLDASLVEAGSTPLETETSRSGTTSPSLSSIELDVIEQEILVANTVQGRQTPDILTRKRKFESIEVDDFDQPVFPSDVPSITEENDVEMVPLEPVQQARLDTGKTHLRSVSTEEVEVSDLMFDPGESDTYSIPTLDVTRQSLHLPAVGWPNMGMAAAPKTQSNSGMDVGSSGRPQATFSPTTTLEPTYAARARAVAASIASPAITTRFFPQLTANSTAELAGVVQTDPRDIIIATRGTVAKRRLPRIEPASFELEAQRFEAFRLTRDTLMQSFVVDTPGVLRLDARGVILASQWRQANTSSSWIDFAMHMLRCGSFVQFISSDPQSVAHGISNLPLPSSRAGNDAGSVLRLLSSSSSPHLQCTLLLLGGIAWRLVLHYAPQTFTGLNTNLPGLYERTAPRMLQQPRQGPQSTTHCLDSTVTDALIGRLPDGTSLWPHPDVFNKSLCWNGFWEPHNESWFQARLQELQSGRPTLYSDAQWFSVLILHLRPEQRRSKDGEGSIVYAGRKLAGTPIIEKYAVIDLVNGPVALKSGALKDKRPKKRRKVQ